MPSMGGPIGGPHNSVDERYDESPELHTPTINSPEFDDDAAVVPASYLQAQLQQQEQQAFNTGN